MTLNHHSRPGGYYKLNCVPSKESYVSNPPVPQNGTVFGSKVPADVVKLR